MTDPNLAPAAMPGAPDARGLTPGEVLALLADNTFRAPTSLERRLFADASPALRVARVERPGRPLRYVVLDGNAIDVCDVVDADGPDFVEPWIRVWLPSPQLCG